MLSKDFDYHKEVVLEKPLRNALPSDSSLDRSMRLLHIMKQRV